MTSPRPTHAEEDYDPQPFTASQAEALRIATTAGPYYRLLERGVKALESLAKDYALHVGRGR